MKKHIKTEITIAASLEDVWNILTDFKNYSQWNPFIKSIEGDVKVGQFIKINAGGMVFKPEVLVFEKQKELRWLGRLLIKGLFDGEHIFQLIDNKNGTITFKHEEKFSGLLVGMFSKKLDTETKDGFQEMNKRLKTMAEKKMIKLRYSF